MTTLSVVIPVYCEQESLPYLRERLAPVLRSLEGKGYAWELILVDDGSTDATPAMLRSMALEDRRLKVIRFARNFGSHAALKTGFDFASGDCAVNLASDLQEPPELILPMIDIWRDERYPVVAAVRKQIVGSPVNRFFSGAFYRLVNLVTSLRLPHSGADMLLIDRSVLAELANMHERNTDVIGQIYWMGYPMKAVPYDRQERVHGSSGFTFTKKVKLFIDFILCFSYLPVRIYSAIGIIAAVMGAVYGLWLLTESAFGAGAPGWSRVSALMLLIGGIIILGQGILGEYLWRVLDEARARPSRLILETHNIERPNTIRS
ncbi:MAG TPA: glycosyltransferase family 2 protein [Acidobacteriota bacterium]|nr:glycosyltransferase family 2 protein [Acidobacteriota bacterium]